MLKKIILYLGIKLSTVSYQTLSYSANNSWKPETRHLVSSPLSPEEIISKTSTVAVNSNSIRFSASPFQVSEDSLTNNDSSSSYPPTSVEECSAKKYRGREGKELPRRRIGLGKRLKHLLRIGKVTKYCIMFNCQTILTKIKSRLLLNKSQSSWRQIKKMSAKNR